MIRYLPWLGQERGKWPAGRAQSCHAPQLHAFICLPVGEKNHKWDLFNISIVSPRKNRDKTVSSNLTSVFSSGLEVTSQTAQIWHKKSQRFLKGIVVHPKIKILSFTLPQVVLNLYASFFCWTQKMMFWRMLVTKQLPVAIDFYIVWKKILCKSMATGKCFSTRIL